MPTDSTPDPLRTMTVQRVERADGRYLIYYDWAEADDGAQPQPPTELGEPVRRSAADDV